jgi:hypothetical protein
MSKKTSQAPKQQSLKKQQKAKAIKKKRIYKPLPIKDHVCKGSGITITLYESVDQLLG